MTENYVFLSGGTGTPKLLQGFQILKQKFSVIVNTADDWDWYGVHVSPDIDAVIYALSGIKPKNRSWGINNDSFHVIKQLKSLGENVWLNVGDKDLATSLYRTNLLKSGKTLTQAVQSLTMAFNIPYAILPMTNEPVATYLNTNEHGWLHLEEYWVKYQGTLRPTQLEYRGVSAAKISPEIKQVLLSASKIIIGPSNPISSIGPILAIPGMIELLEETRARIIVVSPFINDQPISGPAKVYMESLYGSVANLQSIITYYYRIADDFIFQLEDNSSSLNASGKNLHFTNIWMKTSQHKAQLSQYISDL